MATIGKTNIEVHPLCLGGNVFGWTADEAHSFAVLDAYAGAGGNFVDTADGYSSWVPGHSGGESEALIGRWMKSRGNRNRMVIATKVGKKPGLTVQSAANIRRAAEDSLKRLGTDHIDLYYAHQEDAETPLEETLRAFDALVREGKVRALGASNYTPARLREALAIQAGAGFARYEALQPHYNLMERLDYEKNLAPICGMEKLSCFPYFALARGFLTGKYRAGVTVDSPRSAGASAYLNERGLRVLDVLDELAAGHKTTPAAVALAWLRQQATVTSPIASARTVEQLNDLMPMATLTLTADEVTRLGAAAQG